MRISALIFLLCLPAAAQRARPQPAESLKGRPGPAQPEEHLSEDGRFSWAEGAREVAVYKRGNRRKKSHAVRLPLPEEGAKRKVLFAHHGDYFAVVDEIKQDLGLHLDVKKGAKDAKATVVRAGLTLLDAGGRIRWKKRLRDQHVVGEPGTSPLDVSADGTLAVLLQDKDPYQKARPLLLVYGPRGGARLRLDYLDWRHVDEFKLSPDGRYLAVRGFGRIADHETWDTAVGFYHLKRDKHWVRAVPASPAFPQLKAIDAQGRTCCIDDRGKLYAFTRAGDRSPLSPAEARRRFGVSIK